jgi:ubiquinone/menaquinone biosynthesis C-methylase UbiE
MTTAESVFDRIADAYDELWDGTAIGTSQRQAVWNEIEPLVRRGHRILDLGCGVGADALHLRSLGASPLGIDASAEMVRIARQRGIEALHLPFERLHELNERFDGAISNFGALNCATSLRRVAFDLARLIVPGGYFAACVMGPCCAWEVVHFLLKGMPRKGFRRFGSAPARWRGVEIRYPGTRQIQADLRPYFRLVRWCGIGLCVPPSYIKGVNEGCIRKLARMDARLYRLPIVRALSDHRLLLFERV